MADSSYIQTSTGNRVSRRSVLCGTNNIHLLGKTLIAHDAVVRGDLANVRIGKHCTISQGCVLRPPYKRFKGGLGFFPLVLGDHVFVGERTVVEATAVGSGVYIGRDCVIAKRCILKDNCWVVDGTVLAPDTVVPPFSVFAGAPGRLVRRLPECAPELVRSVARELGAKALLDSTKVPSDTVGAGAGGSNDDASANASATSSPPPPRRPPPRPQHEQRQGEGQTPTRPPPRAPPPPPPAAPSSPSASTIVAAADSSSTSSQVPGSASSP